VAMDANETDLRSESVKPFVRLMMVSENDCRATGEMPMSRISNKSVGIYETSETAMNKKKLESLRRRSTRLASTRTPCSVGSSRSLGVGCTP
jgi:hypothetical protein